MVSYFNLHSALEQRRTVAMATESGGPRLLVAGPANVGKSSLCRILINYATRLQRRPLYVDLDVGDGALAAPCTVSIAAIDHPVDTSGRFVRPPLMLHYGHMNPNTNPKLFDRVIEQAAGAVEERTAVDRNICTSGLIVNTSGLNQMSLRHAVTTLQIDTIVVIDDERLYNELLSQFSTQTDITVTRVAKSGGVVARNEAERESAREDTMRRYFYGTSRELHPYSMTVRFDELKVFKIGAPALPAACLPIDSDPSTHETELVPVMINNDLTHKCLSVSASPLKVEANGTFPKMECLGFICVQEVDVMQRQIKILAPAPYPLPMVPCSLLECEHLFNS